MHQARAIVVEVIFTPPPKSTELAEQSTFVHNEICISKFVELRLFTLSGTSHPQMIHHPRTSFSIWKVALMHCFFFIKESWV